MWEQSQATDLANRLRALAEENVDNSPAIATACANAYVHTLDEFLPEDVGPAALTMASQVETLISGEADTDDVTLEEDLGIIAREFDALVGDSERANIFPMLWDYYAANLISGRFLNTAAAAKLLRALAISRLGTIKSA